MIDGFVDITPTEAKKLEVDFASEIPSGDSISAAGATGAVAIDSSGSTATSTVITSSAVSGTKLVITLKAGMTDGMDYRLTATAEMDTANTIFQKVYEIRCRALRRTF